MILLSSFFKKRSIFFNKKLLILTLKCSFSLEKYTILNKKLKMSFILHLIQPKILKLFQILYLKINPFHPKVCKNLKIIQLLMIQNHTYLSTLNNHNPGWTSTKWNNSQEINKHPENIFRLKSLFLFNL